MSHISMAPAPEWSRGTGRQHRGRVLVVDDEANALSALVDWLGEEGYEVKGAASGEDALELLDEFGPEAVLTDLQMPGMTGLDLIDAARRRRAGCVFVVMTAYPSSYSLVDSVRRGAHEYLTKPLALDRVSSAVEGAVTRARRPLETG